MSEDRTHPGLGEVAVAKQIITSDLSPRRVRNIILLLAASVGLMMTGFGIIMPVFARRLGEFGSGVEALGLMTMSFALAQFVAAPFMGSLADRLGRRPLILVALAAFAIANVGFLLAPSTVIFTLVRAFEGGFTAGLFPAALGIIADIVPEDRRAQSVGIVMGSYGAGFIFGPTLGGFLYDGLGFAAPFVVSAVLASLAVVAAFVLIPETRTSVVRRREMLRRRREAAGATVEKESFWDTLPRPLYLLGALLLIDFMSTFSFAFVEPQMVFYFYEQLGWTTVRFGVVVGGYGLAMVVSQAGLGQLSDRFGRRPIIVVGLLMTATFYLGLALVTTFGMMMLVAVVAGLGIGLTMPAMSAFYLDITSEQHRSRWMGIKESAVALGGVIGPLLVVAASALTTPQGVFIIAAVMLGLTALLAVFALRERRRVVEKPGDVVLESARQRALSAQASLRGVVMSARSARVARDGA
jgi:multidrug resistance protein